MLMKIPAWETAKHLLVCPLTPAGASVRASYHFRRDRGAALRACLTDLDLTPIAESNLGFVVCHCVCH